MANKTLSQEPVASPISGTDVYYTEQAGVTAQVSAATLASYIMQGSAVAPTEVPISGNTTVSISPVQNQIIIATVAASNYTITFPAVTVAQKNMRVLVMREGATAGILSLAGLNNFGGTVRSFNDQDCIVVEVVNTTGTTYAWEVTSMLSTGNYAPSGSSFSIQPGDLLRQLNITTGGSNFTLTTPAGSSTPLGEFIVCKVDSGAGAVALTPTTGDAYGALSVNTVFYLVNQGDSVHIKSNGVTGYNFIADYSGGNAEHYTVESGFSVSTGVCVEILADGNIKQFRRYSAAPLDLSLAFQTQMVKIVPLTINANGSGTAVAFYSTSATNIQAVVLSISADLVITAGTSISVATITSQSNFMDAIALSSTLVLFAYQQGAGMAQVTANTISISGTTITLNSSAACPDTTCAFSCLQPLSSTSVVWMAGKLATSYYLTARVISVSGTTITWNGNSDSTAVSASLTSIQGKPTSAINKAGNQCYFQAEMGSAAGLILGTWWVSGTTITFKATNTVSVGVSTYWYRMSYPGRSGAFALITDSFNIPRLIPFQIPEVQQANVLSLPIAGSGYNVNSYFLVGNSLGGTTTNLVDMDLIADDCLCVGLPGGNNGAAGFSPQFYMMEVGPMKIDRTAEAYQPDITHAILQSWVGRLTDDIAICAWASTTGLYFGALRRRRRVAGIAVDASGTIVRRGLSKGLSGLTQGARYFMSDTGALVTAGTDLPVGIALSATTLEVDMGKAA